MNTLCNDPFCSVEHTSYVTHPYISARKPDANGITLDEMIAECELRADHRGGKSYDHIPASSALLFLKQALEDRKVLEMLEGLVSRGDVHIQRRMTQMQGDVVRVSLDVQNGFAVSSPTVKEALIRIGETYL